MKHYIKVSLIALLTLSSVVKAQDPALKKKMDDFAKEFDALKKDQRINFLNLKQKASEASRDGKFFTSMVAIDDARLIFKGDMDLTWLYGICLAQIQDVDGAIEYYEKVLKVNPIHIPSLMNMVEINFFAGRYEKALKHIEHMNNLLDNRANATLPLLDFKYLICLTKLAKTDPKYNERLKKMQSRYDYMSDNPYYYYANALKAFDVNDKQEGLIWILKAYLIFNSPTMIETWNKALVDTGYIGAHEILFKRKAHEE